jgi:ribosomal protein S14
MILQTETLNTSKRNTPNTLLKCVFCGKTAIVLYKGFSLCRQHHFNHMWQERQEAQKQEILYGDYNKALKKPITSKQQFDKFTKDYIKIFGVE